MSLPTPLGGALVDAVVDRDRARELRERARSIPSWTLTQQQIADLDLLVTGAFSPLAGFMTRRECENVQSRSQLSSGAYWPVPITLNISEAAAAPLGSATHLALREPEGAVVAVMTIEDVWASASLDRNASYCVGGPVEALTRPPYVDVDEDLRRTPAAVRAHFSQLQRSNVIVLRAFDVYSAATQAAAASVAADYDAGVLLQPVDPTFAQGHRGMIVMRALSKVIPSSGSPVLFAMLPRGTHALEDSELGAIVARNYGCSHVMATAANLKRGHAEDRSGVVWVTRPPVKGDAGGGLNPEQVLERFQAGQTLPDGFAAPQILDALAVAYPPRSRQGFTVFFTGLSGSGKSTVAKALHRRLISLTNRRVTLLDGDLVRKHLSPELGFARRDRELNIRRISFVASEITKHGGIAICAPIAPYDAMRKEARSLIEAEGGFTLVHISTPLDVCEQRDPKGLYQKARAGVIPEFTGISDPYEAPDDANIVLDLSQASAEEAVDRIHQHLTTLGYLP